MQKYIKPEFNKRVFTCPHCGVLSQIKWHMDKALNFDNHYTKELDTGYCFAQCEYCQGIMCFSYKLLSVYEDPYDGWIEKFDSIMLYPKQIGIPPAEDMPEHIKEIYKEASLIFEDSPRASCVLLRVVLEEFLHYLKTHYEEYSDLKNNTIYNDIKILIEKHNLSVSMQQALDIARIMGNNASHKKTLVINDDLENAKELFIIINLIIDEMITKPKKIKQLYEKMPNGQKMLKEDN